MTEIATRERISGWVTRHPFASFVLVAYGISWTLWGIAAVGGGTVVFLAGVFGPTTGSSWLSTWSRRRSS